MKKISIKFEEKKIVHLNAIKGGSNGKGTKSSARGKPQLL